MSIFDLFENSSNSSFWTPSPTIIKFSNFEEVVYKNEGQQNVGGLGTDSTYFVSNVGLTSAKLFPTQVDAISGINTVEFTSFGIGKQFINTINNFALL